MLLEGRNLIKHFDGVHAVDGVSIRVARGEIVAVVGPNGAGKSTLLDLLTGAQHADSGDIVVDGTSVTGQSLECFSQVGCIRTYQQPRYVAELTVLQNVLLGYRRQTGEGWIAALRRAGWCDEEARLTASSMTMLAGLGLDTLAHQRAKALSFGQLKLLTLGMVLIDRPAIVGLDEPVAGLASHFRDVVAATIEKRRQDAGFLIIEHDLAFVRSVADRVLLMAEGRVLMEGPPDQVLDSDVALDAYVGREAGHAA